MDKPFDMAPRRMDLFPMLEAIDATPSAFSSDSLIGACLWAREEIERLRAALRMVVAELARLEDGNLPSAALTAGRDACNG